MHDYFTNYEEHLIRFIAASKFHLTSSEFKRRKAKIRRAMEYAAEEIIEHNGGKVVGPYQLQIGKKIYDLPKHAYTGQRIVAELARVLRCHIVRFPRRLTPTKYGEMSGKDYLGDYELMKQAEKDPSSPCTKDWGEVYDVDFFDLDMDELPPYVRVKTNAAGAKVLYDKFGIEDEPPQETGIVCVGRYKGAKEGFPPPLPLGFLGEKITLPPPSGLEEVVEGYRQVKAASMDDEVCEMKDLSEDEKKLIEKINSKLDTLGQVGKKFRLGADGRFRVPSGELQTYVRGSKFKAIARTGATAQSLGKVARDAVEREMVKSEHGVPYMKMFQLVFRAGVRNTAEFAKIMDMVLSGKSMCERALNFDEGVPEVGEDGPSDW